MPRTVEGSQSTGEQFHKDAVFGPLVQRAHLCQKLRWSAVPQLDGIEERLNPRRLGLRERFDDMVFKCGKFVCWRRILYDSPYLKVSLGLHTELKDCEFLVIVGNVVNR